MLLLNVAIGFATEFRARRAMDALLRLDAPSATVVRQGKARTLDARELVPGDIVELEPGQALPADARLLVATGLQIIEASLTGESNAVAKSAEAELPADTPLPDRVTMVYKGTTVTDGVARAVVVALSAVVLTVVLQVLAVVAPGLGRVLGTVPLSTRGWVIAAGLGAIPALAGQGWKLLRQSRESARVLARGAR